MENLKRINEKISHKYDPVFEMTNEVNLIDRDPKLARNIFQKKYIKQMEDLIVAEKYDQVIELFCEPKDLLDDDYDKKIRLQGRILNERQLIVIHLLLDCFVFDRDDVSLKRKEWRGLYICCDSMCK